MKYRVPISAYSTFNINTAEKIRNAKKGSTMKISTPCYVSFHEMIKDALIQNPDVTVVVEYKYNQKSWQMTIPAGERTESLEKLWKGTRFVGFRAMGAVFPTVMK